MFQPLVTGAPLAILPHHQHSDADDGVLLGGDGGRAAGAAAGSHGHLHAVGHPGAATAATSHPVSGN